MKTKIMPVLVLTVVCLVASLVLSGINMITAPIIKDRQDQAATGALAEVLPGGSGFKPLTLTESYPPAVSEAYSAVGGFVFRVTGAGKIGDIVMMIGVDSDGKIAGAKVIAEDETEGYGIKVYSIVEGPDGVYNGQTIDNFSPTILTGQATGTSQGVADCMEAALKAYIVANGGEVDNRTPEEILMDNCNAALGTEGLTFTKWFATEVITGIKAVYESAEGRVYVIGETFIGVKDGAVVTAEVSLEDTAAVLGADTIIENAGELITVDVPVGAGAEIVNIKKTVSGNYVFELSAKGYDVSFDYSNGNINGNPKPISIKLSISADSKIIDVLTQDHAESEGFGDACATEDYYNQYKDKGSSDIVISAGKPDYMKDQIPNGCPDIGAISSATYTTVAYQTAVKAAFAAFEIITGGDQ